MPRKDTLSLTGLETVDTDCIKRSVIKVGDFFSNFLDSDLVKQP